MIKAITIPTIVLSLTLAMASLGHAESPPSEATLALPPASLADHYPPASERPQWLYTMFRLRRAMQAITEYSALEDAQKVAKWSNQLAKDYRQIGEMVPQWRDELEDKWIERLLSAAKKMDSAALATAQRKIGQSCSGCHREYRAVAALLHRAADFSQLTIEDEETMEEVKYKDLMGGLNSSFDRIAVALEDGHFSTARKAQQQLSQRFTTLAGGCSACHSSSRQLDYLFDGRYKQLQTELGKAIAAKDGKGGITQLFKLGGAICSSCHGIHRIASDLRTFLRKE